MFKYFSFHINEKIKYSKLYECSFIVLNIHKYSRIYL
jgi:hypothetical protein